MDINECAERILMKHLKPLKRVSHIWGYQLRHVVNIIVKNHIPVVVGGGYL